jgi:hypothetical protein
VLGDEYQTIVRYGDEWAHWGNVFDQVKDAHNELARAVERVVMDLVCSESQRYLLFGVVHGRAFADRDMLDDLAVRELVDRYIELHGN